MRFFMVVCLALGATQAIGACDPGEVALRGDWGRAQFRVEIADDDAERAEGLMFRESMARSAGMLFLYDRPQPVAFWMKNTLISLDMIFVDPTGTVQHVHENAVPGDLTGIPGGDNIIAVLEINGGLSDIYGIEAGSQMQHPFFGDDAVWPCDDTASN
ncbi:DUF192 domain-containing protein [Actibacterium sp. 188UL27-1]|uniref:DUF192 domain-containing protein n=1 Tax=Actibacterium sp. 188UL27-1 TaxID=2786961 RepID=UPI00195BC1DC|nr:DUF192 domain-containing protein [Actibacterium sp. 188UL27-1]MBM7067637.1 DUF192 domain-containing protein [Actibacterium sp. 188UL27-1]